ncbi:arylsulfatase B [Novipirellula artificiosorum]|uniref:Arylsulfatase n=1 Tax=Novipirellula artificiosorum TaxID=2528016 RepID=A0A5C6CWY5_9BACT|nr:arylsulfatase [Novipirellula artificiosorum]TWU29072.1 Arylsulfatase [Novipirellula artificiosorum]
MKLQLFYYILVVAALICVVPANANADAPNIVHIIADDLGWNDVGYHGSEIKTPHLDALASESVILDRFYVTPICSPTRAGVLTGRYPFRFGIWGSVCNPLARHGLPPTEQTTPELLKLAGYQHRAVFGKWHLGLASTKFHPLRHGFTDFYGHYNGAIDYFSRKRFGQLDWHRNYKSVHEEGYSTDLLGAAAVNFISERSAESPFYLLVTFNAPHSPIQAKPEDLKAYGFDPDGDRAPNTDAGIARREKFAAYGEGAKGNTVRQTFAAMTTAMDRNIGTILDALDKYGYRDNTLVIFHSDNGGDPKHGGNNQPLRGKKFTTWEGGVCVPAIMRWPNQLDGGTKFSSVASYVDLLPTQLAAAGQPIPNNLDGINLLPLLQRRTDAPDRAILLSDRAAVTDRWKLQGDELFDLSNDPNETQNVSDQRAKQFQKLKRQVAGFTSMKGERILSALETPTPWPPLEWTLPDEKPAIDEQIQTDQ